MCSVKRENNCITVSCNTVILDIEGTTTSISFVKETLFPYVREHLEAYLKENWDSEVVQAIVDALRSQAKEDKEKNLEGFLDIPVDGEKDDLINSVIKNVLWQMDLDSKAKSLKDLQGLIMENGYKKGELKGHIYEDVEENLKLWTELGKCIYIYSSGSVHAQKLLFGHTGKGDLLPYIKGHFDTTVGKKSDVESYKKIIDLISCSPSETVFLTDIPKEARAAKGAGLLAALLSRDGNAPLADEDKEEFQVLTSFSEVQFENTFKKRKVCSNDGQIDNKTVESCEVSVKNPKEPTNSTLPKQHDDKMEVEESYCEAKICIPEKTDCERIAEKKDHCLQEVTGNSDVEMRPTNVTKGEKSSKKIDCENGSQMDGLSNSDIVSDKLNIDEHHDKSNKEIVDKDTKLSNKTSHETLDPVAVNGKSENLKAESQHCEDKASNNEDNCKSNGNAGIQKPKEGTMKDDESSQAQNDQNRESNRNAEIQNPKEVATKDDESIQAENNLKSLNGREPNKCDDETITIENSKASPPTNLNAHDMNSANDENSQIKPINGDCSEGKISKISQNDSAEDSVENGVPLLNESNADDKPLNIPSDVQVLNEITAEPCLESKVENDDTKVSTQLPQVDKSAKTLIDNTGISNEVKNADESSPQNAIGGGKKMKTDEIDTQTINCKDEFSNLESSKAKDGSKSDVLVPELNSNGCDTKEIVTKTPIDTSNQAKSVDLANKKTLAKDDDDDDDETAKLPQTEKANTLPDKHNNVSEKSSSSDEQVTKESSIEKNHEENDCFNDKSANEVDDTKLCEVKKCEVAEAPTISAVVEA
ncbi:enolase-phosphatase E1 [Macrosteles quadrilineatus]|uniref:enolase-phosphatase E1 n=1 Tax=Macrosteles quadrilineatus TaxID=74068 RepID=UPI0023E13120|nr:enolase-phosphatase E1 [Macrosteles quadrilineatus]